LTGSSVILAQDGFLFGCLVETDGTNAVTLSLYDNASAGSGKVLRKIIVPGANNYGGFELPIGIEIAKGIYATVSGTGAAFWVTYGVR
jgi:hypothetical protein